MLKPDELAAGGVAAEAGNMLMARNNAVNAALK